MLIAATAFGSHAAFAHNQVAATTPQAGETVTESPVDIDIVTTDQLLDLGGTTGGFAITVQDDAGQYYGDGCVKVDGPALRATADLGDAGDYTVTYQYISADGHSLSDAFNFVFDPVPGHSPASGSASPPICGEAAADEVSAEEPEALQPAEPIDAEAVPSSEQAPDIAQTMAWSGPVITAGIGMVALATMGYLFWERNRQKR